MKSIKTIVCAAALVAAGATVSHAQTRVNFTGSTAYRGQTIAAIKSVFNTGFAEAYTGATETSANAAIFSGTIGSTTYIIKTYWSGSEAGIQSVDQDGVGIALNFVSDTPSSGGPGHDITLVAGTAIGGIDDPTSGVAGDYTSAVPDVDMADTYQATSQFHGSYQGHSYNNLTGATATGNTLGNGIVGVVPFQFVTSSHATFTNVTAQNIRALFANGKLPKSLITGVAGDETSFVYATGRDPDSGTRLTAFAESGYGAINTVFQYEPLTSGSALVTSTGSTIASLVLWPDETVNGFLVSSPNGGYNSGGKLAGALGSETTGMVVYDSLGNATGTNGDLLTYLSTGDAGTAVGGGAKTLSYNGNAFSTTNVQEGLYTFWGYEHMYYRTLTTPVKTVVNSIATNIFTTQASVKVPNMRVKRTIDGAVVVNTF